MSDPEKRPDTDPSEEPKLVVDTDWKEQVAREKEQAGQEQAPAHESSQPSASPPQSEPDTEQAAAGQAASDAQPTTSAEPESAPDSSTAPDSPSAPESSGDDSAASGGDAEMPAPPPATFEVLVSMMFTQAMAMLGHMPDPSTGKSSVNKPFAKHYIDTLEMLGEKTQGNLSDAEKKVLSEALHALRMMYVSAGK